MKYKLRENQGIPAPLLALMAIATGLSVANTVASLLVNCFNSKTA